MNNELILVTRNNTPNNLTSSVLDESLKHVFCNIKSVRSSEFIALNTLGVKPTIIFEIYPFEYSGENEIEYMNQRYTLIRTYDNQKTKRLELVCERKVRNLESNTRLIDREP